MRIGRGFPPRSLIRAANIIATVTAVGTAAGTGTATAASAITTTSSLLLLEAGTDHYQLEDGSGNLLIEIPAVEGVGAATGTGTATGVGFALKPMLGTASGAGRAAAVGVRLGTLSSIGAAAGAGTAAGLSAGQIAGVGIAVGSGTATGIAVGVIPELQGIDLQFAIGTGAFAEDAFNASAFGGSTWTSVLNDTRDEDPIVLDYGVQGNGPADRVAGTGTLSFTLNNAIDNSGGLRAYYSPLNPLRRQGHALNVPVRLVITINSQPYYKFLGRLSDIDPEPGVNGTFRCPCIAVDLMDDWAANDMPDVLPVAQNENTGALLGRVLNVLTNVPSLVPPDTSIETGIGTVPFAFHDPNRTKIRELMIDIVMSELGFAALIGGPSTAGTLRFYNRQALTTYPSRGTLVNQFSVNGGFVATTSRDDIASSVEVFVYPTKVDPVPVDIFKLDGSPVLVLPFTETLIRLPYMTAERPDSPIGALGLTPIVPYTDYTMNAQQDGGGADLTTSFIVQNAYPLGGASALIRVTNMGGIAGFVTLLKGQGYGLYITEASVKVETDTPYGRRPLTVVMPMQANVNTASDLAHFFSNLYKNAYGQIESVSFCASKTHTLLEYAVYFEPGDTITIQETITSIAGRYRIQGVRLEIRHGVIWCTWRLAYVSSQDFWLLGLATHSELGQTTALGF